MIAKGLKSQRLLGGVLCTEAVFKRLNGVKSVIPGYSGGTLENPSYDEVCTGRLDIRSQFR
jgi:peptide methionine sulfoxide reductase MsrA